MWIEVKENAFVNLSQVKHIFLEWDDEWSWVFVYSASPWDSEEAPGYLCETSQRFKTREEALKWFEENIKPALNDYNHSKFNV